MGKVRLFVVIVALSLATMACSLSGSSQSSDEPNPVAFPTATALAQSTVHGLESAPTLTPAPSATPLIGADRNLSDASDLGIVDVDSAVDSAEKSDGAGEALAVESLSSIQSDRRR